MVDASCLRLSEDELTGYFTGAIGVRAQNYDAFGTGDSARDPEAAMINGLAAATLAIEQHDLVVRTLALVDGWSTWVLARVYTPRRWCEPELARALNGIGATHNLSGLAALTERAQRFALKHGDADDEAVVLRILDAERERLGVKAMQGETVLTLVRDEAEAMRLEAVLAYERVRVARDPRAVPKKERESMRTFMATPPDHFEALLAGRGS